MDEDKVKKYMPLVSWSCKELDSYITKLGQTIPQDGTDKLEDFRKSVLAMRAICGEFEEGE